MWPFRNWIFRSLKWHFPAHDKPHHCLEGAKATTDSCLRFVVWSAEAKLTHTQACRQTNVQWCKIDYCTQLGEKKYDSCFGPCIWPHVLSKQLMQDASVGLLSIWRLLQLTLRICKFWNVLIKLKNCSHVIVNFGECKGSCCSPCHMGRLNVAL